MYHLSIRTGTSRKIAKLLRFICNLSPVQTIKKYQPQVLYLQLIGILKQHIFVIEQSRTVCTSRKQTSSRTTIIANENNEQNV